MNRDELREALAALEHEQWMEWSRTLVETGERITPDRLSRWIYYWRPYEDLDEQSKDFDRAWADKVLEILDQLLPWDEM